MGKGSKKRNVDTVATSQPAETFLLRLLQFVEKSTLEITFPTILFWLDAHPVVLLITITLCLMFKSN